MAKKINDLVTWVGKIDWELTHFHGDELSTDKGSSYNSYLIEDEKTALIDTVWQPYDTEFMARLQEVVDINKIDCIIMQHNEIDHSGALPELMRLIPDTPIYCTAKGEQIIRGHYHQNWNFVRVKTGDTLNLGKHTITFIEAPMLHWPDTMFSYLDCGILFSNDAFGQHFASESLYNNRVNSAELYYEAEKYYCNILNPFSPLVKKKIADITAMNLDIKLICPSHGLIWKDNPLQIVEQYARWADNYQENQITIVYDTMWNSTRLMAQAIAEGIEKADKEVTVKLYNLSKEDKNDVLTQMFRSKAVLVGSPTINNGISHAVAGVLEMAKGLKFKNKKAAAFGSYGWGGEGVKLINERLAGMGLAVVNDGLRLQWVPDQDGINACREFGEKFVSDIA